MKKLFFGENLKFLREKKGLKQSEMIDFVGVKQTTWNGYEKGNSFPKFEDLIKISKYFDISETDLIHNDLESGVLMYENNTEISNNTLNEPTEQYINYKDLAEARKETIDSLKREINYLQEKVDLLTNKRKAG